MAVNYTFPLPSVDLHKRYDCIFDGFKRGLSTLLVGLPESHRSSYLKFVLGYDSTFLREFISEDYKFIMVDETPKTANEFIKLLLFKVSQLDDLSQTNKDELQKALVSGDSLIGLLTLEQILKKLPNHIKIVFVVYQIEKIAEYDIQIVSVLAKFERRPPVSKIHFCFIASPTIFEKLQEEEWAHIRGAFEENVCYFPLFTKKELDYTRRRMEALLNNKISETVHKIACAASGRHPVIYRSLVSLPQSELQKLQNPVLHPSLNGLLKTIWQGIPKVAQLNWNLEFISNYYPLVNLGFNNNSQLIFQPSVRIARKAEDVNELTAQQKLIFDYLKGKPDQVITREEIAQVLWGKDWEEQYSDWALNKCMSELKKKLIKSSHSILTIRNRGYKYVSS